MGACASASKNGSVVPLDGMSREGELTPSKPESLSWLSSWSSISISDSLASTDPSHIPSLDAATEASALAKVQRASSYSSLMAPRPKSPLLRRCSSMGSPTPPRRRSILPVPAAEYEYSSSLARALDHRQARALTNADPFSTPNGALTRCQSWGGTVKPAERGRSRGGRASLPSVIVRAPL